MLHPARLRCVCLAFPSLRILADRKFRHAERSGAELRVGGSREPRVRPVAIGRKNEGSKAQDSEFVEELL